MQLSTNTLLQGGKYRIERVLGQGGFGITYLGTLVALNRKVAIKEFFMKEYCNRDSETSQVSVPSEGCKEQVGKFRQKFIKEANIISQLNHPHIIKIFDIFQENGTAYYVMEYWDNGSLADYVRSRGKLDETEALDYISQVADALSYLHKRKINHLDVKPGNLLLDRDMNILLIDFGTSKRYDKVGNETSATPVPHSAGYTPLEQYQKNGVSTFSPTTDIYSLGATLYKMLTGKTPPEASYLIDEDLPPLPARVSKTTASAIKAAMQPSKKKRPQSVAEFMALLGIKVKENSKVPVVDARQNIRPAVKEKKKNDYNSQTNRTRHGQQSYGDNVQEETILSKGVKNENKGEEKGKKKMTNNQILRWMFGIIGLAWFSLWLADHWLFIANIDLYYTYLVFITFGAIIISLFVWKPADSSVSPLTNSNNGHKYVDLGLSVKWADRNVGASSPSDYGSCFAWGETNTKSEYLSDNSITYEKSFRDIAGNSQYDAARANWNGNWRLPTMAECQELVSKCEWKWTTQDGHNGYKVTGPNGNSIFLPAAGWRNGLSLSYAGEFGGYWSSTPNESNTQGACNLFFFGGDHLVGWNYRDRGRSVRPVSD